MGNGATAATPYKHITIGDVKEPAGPIKGVISFAGSYKDVAAKTEAKSSQVAVAGASRPKSVSPFRVVASDVVASDAKSAARQRPMSAVDLDAPDVSARRQPTGRQRPTSALDVSPRPRRPSDAQMYAEGSARPRRLSNAQMYADVSARPRRPSDAQTYDELTRRQLSTPAPDVSARPRRPSDAQKYDELTRRQLSTQALDVSARPRRPSDAQMYAGGNVRRPSDAQTYADVSSRPRRPSDAQTHAEGLANPGMQLGSSEQQTFGTSQSRPTSRSGKNLAPPAASQTHALNRQDAGASSSRKGSKNKYSIKRIKCVADFYEWKEQVMPSTNPGIHIKLARRLVDGKDVIVKVYRKATAFGSRSNPERIMERIQQWRQTYQIILNLPPCDKISRVFEVLEDKDCFFVSMEKCEGQDLYEYLHSDDVLDGQVTVEAARAILRPLLHGVQMLHNEGCIHKDLKFENVIVDKIPSNGASARDISDASDKPAFTTSMASKANKDEPKVADSEPVVKLIDFDTVEQFKPSVIAKHVAGTVQYIPPEAYAGHYSPASDIFSVGVIAYRMMTGTRPFKKSIFDNPSRETYVGSPKMNEIEQRLRDSRVNWEIRPWPDATHATDLIQWMMATNDKDRPTVAQCLQHRFFLMEEEAVAAPAKCSGAHQVVDESEEEKARKHRHKEEERDEEGRRKQAEYEEAEKLKRTPSKEKLRSRWEAELQPGSSVELHGLPDPRCNGMRGEVIKLLLRSYCEVRVSNGEEMELPIAFLKPPSPRQEQGK